MSGTGPPPSNGMKVAFILHRFPYLTETFIVRDMMGLQRSGVDVTIFSLLRPRHALVSADARRLLPSTRYSRLLSARILQSQWWFLRRKPGRYFKALGELLGQTWREPPVMLRALALFPVSVDIARQAESIGIDHVHANFVWLEALAAGVVHDLTGVPFSIRPHAFGLFGRNRVSVRRQLEKAARVVTISDYHRRYVADMTRLEIGDIDIVHLGIDTSRFAPTERPLPPDDPVRILSIGRGVEKKGHRYLVEACSRLVSDGFDFRCDLVVGRGAERDALAEQITALELAGIVSLLDYRDEPQIIELYRRSHIFALACVVAGNGDQDGMPNVILEAMACGLPVVTTPVAGIPELVADGRNGILVPPRDVDRLAAALGLLIDEPERRSSQGRSGRATVQESFEIGDTARQLAEVFSAYRRHGSDAVPSVRSKGA